MSEASSWGTESPPDHADIWRHSASVRSNPTGNSHVQGMRSEGCGNSAISEGGFIRVAGGKVLLDRDQVSVERAGSLFSSCCFCDPLNASAVGTA
jgi:hypothetical protein